MTSDLVIKDAKIVTPEGIFEGGIAIDEGKIVSVTTDGDLLHGSKVVNAGGKYLIPGLVDPHTHLGGKYPIDRDFKTETPGAAVGGVTTIGNIARVPRMGQPFKEITEPQDVVSWSTVFDYGKKISQENTLVDFFFNFTLNSMQHAEEIPQYASKLGVTSFKYHGNLKAHGDNPVSPRWAARIGIPLAYDDSLAYVAMEKIASVGPPAAFHVHCENTEIAKVFADRLSKQGRKDPAAWAERSPGFLEAEHVYRYSYLSKVTKCPLYILHLSSIEGLEAVRKGRIEGVNITVETCPQYLVITKKDVPPGYLGKVNPPIRTAEDNEALWRGIRDGWIDCIGTDHVVTNKHEKLVKGDTSDHDEDPATNIWHTGSGFIGMETLAPAMLSEGVNKGRISFERMVEVCCRNTAKASGLYPRKGAISVGSDADVVLVDMQMTKKMKSENLHSFADFTIFEGREFKGWPIMTILRGNIIAEDGNVVAKPGIGTYLPRTPTKATKP